MKNTPDEVGGIFCLKFILLFLALILAVSDALSTNPQNNRQMKNLTPVSQVICKALMESNHTDAEKAIEFLQEAEDLWKHKKAASEYKHAGAYFLARAYYQMEKEHIIGVDGHILNANALCQSGRLNGFLCRPSGYAPVDFSNTKTFKELISCTTKIYTNKER